MKQMSIFAEPFSKISLKNCFIIAAAMTLLLLVVSGCKGKEEQVAKLLTRPVKVISVTGMADTGIVSLPGKTRANRRADLSFKVSGPLVELSVEEGQKVKKGELIARIDPRDFETGIKEVKSSLSEAKANLKSMQRGARIEDIRMLEAEVDAATSEYFYAEDQYKRYKQLWVKQHASRADFDRQNSLRNTAKARLEGVKQDLAKGKKGARKEDVEAQQSRIRGLEARLKAASDALDDTSLRAPFDGVVAKRYLENHQEVQAKQPIVFFQDISSIEVLVDVPENQASEIRKGAMPDVVARFASAPGRAFPLTFKEFSTKVDPQTLTYQAVLVMPRPAGSNILPGMTATVDRKPKSTQANSHGIVIPAIAVTRSAEKRPYVWILNESDMTVNRADVKAGELTGSDSIKILDGLNLGEKVVTAGVTKLQAGMKVTIWDEGK